MSSAVARQEASWGELGPAMQALSPQQREFVRAFLTEKPGHGAITRAARRAGYGKNSEASVLSKNAHQLRWSPKICAAIQEEARKYSRGPAYAEAVSAMMNVIRDPAHRDHGRMVAMVVDRADPSESRHSIDVTHRTVDPDREALEELKALRKLGTARDKLLELYGPNGLDRLEALEAVETAQRANAAKLIDLEVTRG